MLVGELATPAALVDLDRLEANTSRMSERMRRLGVRFRPHVKTHKCVEAARFQVQDHFGGITVSTLAEARYFGRAGFRDITYAVPIAPGRIDEAVEIARSLDTLNLLVDNEATFNAFEAAAVKHGVMLSTFLKVDCGYHRAGVDPESEEAIALALRIHKSRHVDLKGILTHAGHSYHAAGMERLRKVGEQERNVMVRFAEKLASMGVAPLDVSVGSTPTMSCVDSLEGVTEARAGNYVFYDRFQAAIGSCSIDDVAFSVVVTVTGNYPGRNELLVDAGALAFSKDEGPTHIDPDCGYGTIFRLDGARPMDHLKLASLSQEHGKILGTGAIAHDEVPIGSKLRIVPNHSCLSAALFDRYYVTRSGKVVEEWRPVRGW